RLLRARTTRRGGQTAGPRLVHGTPGSPAAVRPRVAPARSRPSLPGAPSGSTLSPPLAAHRPPLSPRTRPLTYGAPAVRHPRGADPGTGFLSPRPLAHEGRGAGLGASCYKRPRASGRA